jgi:hypothetical protein
MNEEDSQFVQQYAVKIHADPISDTTKDIFLIRHGFSEFNYRHLILKTDGGKDGQPW